MVEAIKHEVNKYVKRERRKKLPANVDFWDFDCKFGQTEDVATEIHLAEIRKYIDKTVEQNQESFYLEILAKPGIRRKKDSSASSE